MIDTAKETLFLSDDLLFYTLEGEGELIGQPSVFMRLSMCNLTCIGFKSEDSPNGCDSYVSWSVKNKMTFDEIFQYMEDKGLINRLKVEAVLKITGGEPILQQKQLLKFVEALSEKYDFRPRIDFETNGTLMPDLKWVDDFGATFTVSPKLTTNGDPESKPDVLCYHANIQSCFKFVISKAEDIDEIWRKYVEDDKGINLENYRIWFMPCCGSREEHIKVAVTVAEYAKQMNVNFSPRLHLLLWDKALLV